MTPPAAISIFWGAKVFNTDPTPALLADIYYTLHTMYEKRKDTLNCCIRLLYNWFMTHLYKEDYMIPELTRHEWPQKLRSLTANSILWYARKLDIGYITISCEDFPNVLLIGSRGCINYNPALALQQLGYPLQDRPLDEQP